MTFSNTQYLRLKSRLKTRYKNIYKTILKNLKTVENSQLKKWLSNHHEELSIYTSVNWYFLKQVQTFSWFCNHLPELSNKADDFFELDDEVFEQWNKSEFAGVFLEALNKGNSIQKASTMALKVFDQHLVTLGERQILKLNKHHKSYRTQTSLGEITKAKKPTRLLDTTLQIEGKQLSLKTHSFKEMKEFSHRIETALKVIKHFSPESWEQFKAFTEVIIPINRPEFVSYSHQELPGHSIINLYHRDFVDLIDDLLHENGHHHLNYYLNLDKLIDEPIDCIYYSPWRKTLRPFRGIYHAYFTFFWAFRIFSSLAEAKDINSVFYTFSSKEKEKIIWRAIEEYWMLQHSFQDLQWARKNGLITDSGWKIIAEQNVELKRYKNKVVNWEKKLKKHQKDLKNLKITLKEARINYKKL